MILAKHLPANNHARVKASEAGGNKRLCIASSTASGCWTSGMCAASVMTKSQASGSALRSASALESGVAWSPSPTIISVRICIVRLAAVNLAVAVASQAPA